jgi:hypothetical protein
MLHNPGIGELRRLPLLALFGHGDSSVAIGGKAEIVIASAEV